MMKQLARATLMLSVIGMAGCVSVLPEPEAPDALYAIESQAEYDGLLHDVIIREPEAPRLIAGQGIVSEDRNGGLRLVNGVEWSGSATRQFQLAMMDSFDIDSAGKALLPEHGVLARYELASQLKTLQLKGAEATCEVSISLVTTQDRGLVEMIEVSSRQQVSGSSNRDRALALRAAASNCAGQAAAFVVSAVSADAQMSGD